MKRTAAPETDTGPPVSVSRWSRTATSTTALAALAMVLLAAVPYVLGGPAEQPLITLLTFVAMASLWNLLAGFSGLTSFGQQAYIGLGAYALYLVAAHGVNPIAGILPAAVIAAVISLPVSLLVLRLSGGYFAVATLVVAAVFQIVATLSPSVGGTTGVSVPGLSGYPRSCARRSSTGPPWSSPWPAWPGSTCWCGGRSGWTPARSAAIRSPRPASASGWAGSGGWPTWSPRAAPARWGR